MKSSFYAIRKWYKAVCYYIEEDKNGITYIRPETVKYLRIKDFGGKEIDGLSKELKELVLYYEEHLKKNEPQSYAAGKDVDNAIEISKYLLLTAFNQVDEKCLTSIINDMLKIGGLAKEKTFNEIIAFDSWQTDEDKKLKNDIIVKIESFVSKYGLFGILNNALTGLSSSYTLFSNMDIIGSMDVITFASQLNTDLVWNEVEKGLRKPPQIPFSMHVNEYIKLFFPDIPKNVLKLTDEYYMMDNRYFACYSEPVYIFLLAATYLYRKFPLLSNRFKSGSLYDKKTNTSAIEEINVQYTYKYDEDCNAYKTILNFSSLYDIVCYYLVRSFLEGTQNIIVCRHCGSMGIVLNKRSEFCSPECQNRGKAKRRRQRDKINKLNI